MARKIWIIVLALLTLSLPVAAYDPSFEIRNQADGAATVDTSGLAGALTSEAREYIGDMDPQNMSVEEGGKRLWNAALDALRGTLREAAASGFLMLALCLLISVATAFVKAAGLGVPEKVIDITAICALLVITFTSSSSIITQCKEAIKGLDAFSNIFIPMFGLATAVSGRPVSGVASAGPTMIFSKIIITLSYTLFIPSLYLYITTVAAGAMAESPLLDKAAGLIKSVSTSFFKGFLMVFTGYLSISGLVSGTADTAMVKTAQVAISGVVPVVGGIISGVSETLLTGASLLRASIGVYGMLGACAICLVPFVRVFSHLLVFKVLAAVSGSFARGGASKLLDGISSAYSVALGLLGTCCAVQFISIVVGMVVTNR